MESIEEQERPELESESDVVETPDESAAIESTAVETPDESAAIESTAVETPDESAAVESTAVETPDESATSETPEMLSDEEMATLYDESMRSLAEGQIVAGRVIAISSGSVVIDVGYKSEGLVSVREFTDYEGNLTVDVGDMVDVLLEKTEDAEGHVLLSKQKAERMKVWAEIEKSYKAGEIIRGRVIDRIKGGLTVNVGIRAFLPGSLVDIKPLKNLESLRGRELEFKVISMDRRRNNVVLSRKAVLEKEFAAKKAETLTKLKEGTHLPGVVKNITDYGVFIDLGGIDGLLHITDISWGRVNHPSEHFSVGDEVEVVILKFDPETERVSLGFKQKSEDPWSLVDKKFPLGSRVRGSVVSLVDYGAFVELEEGVEGLIHVSEMSWTKKVITPSKILSPGDQVEAIVSELDLAQRRISLSLRQAERNPWEELAVTHSIGSIIDGKVRNLTEFGAFVQITDEIDGLIHVSDMSWTKRVKHPGEILSKGEEVKARITNIDVDNQRVSLSIKEFLPNEWDNFIAEHRVGDTVTGRVVNVTDFGIFVDIYEGLEGLAHVSEIDVPGGALEEVYAVDDWVSARILRVEDDDKKVGLTMRGVTQPTAKEIMEFETAASTQEEPAKVEDVEEAEAEEVAAESPEEDAAEAREVEAAEETSAETGDEVGEETLASEANEESAVAEEELIAEAASEPEEGSGGAADEVEGAASEEVEEAADAEEPGAESAEDAGEEAEAGESSEPTEEHEGEESDQKESSS